MSTATNRKLDEFRRKYGDNHKLYSFEVKGIGSFITVPANDLKTAVKRALVDLKGHDADFFYELWGKLIKRPDLFKKWVKVYPIPLEKPCTWIPSKYL